MATTFKNVMCVSLGMVLGAALPACASKNLNIKTWFLDPAQGGLVRKHDTTPNEFLPFSEAKGYRCVNRADFDYLIYLAKQAGLQVFQ